MGSKLICWQFCWQFLQDVQRIVARKAKVELPSLGEYERRQKKLGEGRESATHCASVKCEGKIWLSSCRPLCGNAQCGWHRSGRTAQNNAIVCLIIPFKNRLAS
jgi:hypothetical protein